MMTTDTLRTRATIAHSARRPPVTLPALARGARRHLFKLGALALALLSYSALPYRLAGLANRRFGFLRSVFYCYPGDSRYARPYCYRWCERWLKWLPAPIGVFRQDGKWGLILASPVSEAEFLDAGNTPALCRLLRRIDRVAALLGASEISRAGILPSVLYQRFGIANARLPRTVALVQQGIAETRRVALAGAAAPIILLGGRGFLGRALHERLRQDGWDVRVVDVADGEAALPRDLRGRACLLLDVARHGALAHCVGQLWPGVVVLNEAFPEPSAPVLRALGQRGVSVYHIAGTPAQVWPSLPRAYRGCIPCCASHAMQPTPAVVVRLV